MHQRKVPLKYRAMLLFPSGRLGLGGAADTMVWVGVPTKWREQKSLSTYILKLCRKSTGVPYYHTKASSLPLPLPLPLLASRHQHNHGHSEASSSSSSSSSLSSSLSLPSLCCSMSVCFFVLPRTSKILASRQKKTGGKLWAGPPIYA